MQNPLRLRKVLNICYTNFICFTGSHKMKQNMQHATCRGEQAGVGREHAEAKVYVGVDLTQRKLKQELRKHKKCKQAGNQSISLPHFPSPGKATSTAVNGKAPPPKLRREACTPTKEASSLPLPAPMPALAPTNVGVERATSLPAATRRGLDSLIVAPSNQELAVPIGS